MSKSKSRLPCPPPRARQRRTLLALSLAAMFGFHSVGALAQAGAVEKARSFDFNLPRQSLVEALDRIRVETGGLIAYVPEQLSGASSPALRGNYTLVGALELLLKNSAFTFKINHDGTIVILPRTGRPQEGGPAAHGDGFATLDEVVVTARKREQALGDVAGSLTSLDGDDLEHRNVNSMADYAAYVPGMSLTSSQPANTQITLRGLTTGTRQASATVGSYVDEVPFTPFSRSASGTTMVPDIDPFDLQRIEVLRGPQGTLYGAGAIGGLVKYVTTPPSIGEWQSRLEWMLGNTSGGDLNYSGKLALNVPVSERSALRASVYRRANSGFVDNLGTGVEQENETTFDGGRVSWLWQPGEVFSLRLSSLYNHVDVEGTPVMDVNYITGAPIYGDLKQSRRFTEEVGSNYQVHNATATWNLGWGELVSSTSYSEIDSRASADSTPSLAATIAYLNLIGYDIHAARVLADIGNRKITQEIRLASERRERMDWLVGAYYTHEDTRVDQRIQGISNGGSSTDFIRYELPSGYREIAGFGSLDIHAGKDVDIEVGVRGSSNDQWGRQLSSGALTARSTLEFDSSDTSWTYHVAPRWRPREGMLVYASASSGYRPGGPNAVPAAITSIVPASFEPDTVLTYEAGLKTELLNRKLVLEAAAFHNDWKDVQLGAAVSGFSYIGNGGKASSRGVELSARYAPAPGWVLGANASYIDATLDEDAPALGASKGDPLPTVPDWSYALVADHSRMTSFGWYVSFGATFRYVGERNSGFPLLATSPNLTMEAYETLGLRAALGNGQLAFSIFADNVFDKRGISGADTGWVPYNNVAKVSLITPRTVGVKVSVAF